MKITGKTIISSLAISMLMVVTSSAYEIPQSQYYNNVKWYVDSEKIDSIKSAPVVNLKAISKGMNLGYLEPKVKEIRGTKEEINSLIEKINVTEITDEKLKTLNEELLTRLNTMYTYLERSEKQYQSLIGYDRHYIGKYFTLKLGEALFTVSADDNLKYYNEDYKEVKRIYKDIKQVMKDM